MRTISLATLFDRFGVPYYVKCDIEGGDRMFAESLQRIGLLPKYVSIEFTRIEDVAHLFVAGYRRFQVVNQFLHAYTVPPQPAREGAFVDAAFDGETSGLFGKELPTDQWVSFPRVSRLLQDWARLRDRAPQLTPGWLDVHAVRPGPAHRVDPRPDPRPGAVAPHLGFAPRAPGRFLGTTWRV